MFLHSSGKASVGPGGSATLISGGHDGAIRAWDMRTFQCIFDVPAHRRKFDEGVLCLASTDKYPLIASGIKFVR